MSVAHHTCTGSSSSSHRHHICTTNSIAVDANPSYQVHKLRSQESNIKTVETNAAHDYIDVSYDYITEPKEKSLEITCTNNPSYQLPMHHIYEYISVDNRPVAEPESQECIYY